ncbi:hypothetical protein H2248_001781 [Termitomyces sp. 'cryptogamus']|nr:hypothetical protein H2248_001781 [Termitomyces sp. 'cryptogamus']
MPSLNCTTTSNGSSSSASLTLSSSATQAPPPHVCARINAQITSNPALARPFFDFAEYVRGRSYIIRNLVFENFESSMLLDKGVEGMLPATFHPPRATPLHTFEIGDAGDRGRGMFALRDLPVGALILVEHPVIVAPYLVGLNVPLVDIYANLFDRLPHGIRIELSQLYDGTDHSLEDVIHLNALGIQLEVPDVPRPELTTHRAVFLNTSRCNHSCGPNAQWEWDISTFSLYLAVVRPIMKGDEITIHYTSCTRPRHERQAILRSQYGFICRCSYCNLPSEDAVHHSDNSRMALGHFWNSLPSFEGWCLDPTLPYDMLIKLHVEALRTIKQEGLQVLDAERHVDAIAMCYGALADTNMFRIWIERVRDANADVDPSRAVVFAKWLSNPTSFPAWSWKKTFCGRKKNVLV